MTEQDYVKNAYIASTKCRCHAMQIPLEGVEPRGDARVEPARLPPARRVVVCEPDGPRRALRGRPQPQLPRPPRRVVRSRPPPPRAALRRRGSDRLRRDSARGPAAVRGAADDARDARCRRRGDGGRVV